MLCDDAFAIIKTERVRASDIVIAASDKNRFMENHYVIDLVTQLRENL